MHQNDPRRRRACNSRRRRTLAPQARTCCMQCIGRDEQLRHRVRSMYTTILGISLGDRAYYTVSVRIRTDCDV